MAKWILLGGEGDNHGRPRSTSQSASHMPPVFDQIWRKKPTNKVGVRLVDCRVITVPANTPPPQPSFGESLGGFVEQERGDGIQERIRK